MGAPSRWLRINIDWDDSDWVAELSVGGQLAWIKTLCHVKREGVAGRVKALSVPRAAKKWGIAEVDIAALLAAAGRDGALLVEDGSWTVTNWGKYQPTDPTNAERQKRFREREAPEDNGGPALGNASRRRATETGTETETVRKRGRSTPARWESALNLNDVVPESHQSERLREVWERFLLHRKARGVAPYTQAGLESVWAHMRNQGFSAAMIPELIERCMAQNWKGLPPDVIDRFAQGAKLSPSTLSPMASRISDLTAEAIRRAREQGAGVHAA